MANAAGDEETANALQTMYDKAKESVGGVQGWLLNTETADKGITGAATLIEGQMSRTNPTFVNFVDNNNLTSSYSGSLQQNNIIKSPIKPTTFYDIPAASLQKRPVKSNIATKKEKEGIDADEFMKNTDKEAAKTLQGENLRYSEEQDLMLYSARPKPTIAQDFATDDKDPVSAEEENLSKAYGGGEASKKFGMKKGGLATRTSKRRKK